MNQEFKPGDLAILKSSVEEHLVGSVVELIEYVGSDVFMTYAGGDMFNPKKDRVWWVKITSGHTFFSEARGVVSDGFCADFRLMPLRGDFQPEKNKEKELEPCL